MCGEGIKRDPRDRPSFCATAASSLASLLAYCCRGWVAAEDVSRSHQLFRHSCGAGWTCHNSQRSTISLMVMDMDSGVFGGCIFARILSEASPASKSYVPQCAGPISNDLHIGAGCRAAAFLSCVQLHGRGGVGGAVHPPAVAAAQIGWQAASAAGLRWLAGSDMAVSSKYISFLGCQRKM